MCVNRINGSFGQNYSFVLGFYKRLNSLKTIYSLIGDMYRPRGQMRGVA